jgi:hypothetical protein
MNLRSKRPERKHTERRVKIYSNGTEHRKEVPHCRSTTIHSDELLNDGSRSYIPKNPKAWPTNNDAKAFNYPLNIKTSNAKMTDPGKEDDTNIRPTANESNSTTRKGKSTKTTANKAVSRRKGAEKKGNSPDSEATEKAKNCKLTDTTCTTAVAEASEDKTEEGGTKTESDDSKKKSSSSSSSGSSSSCGSTSSSSSPASASAGLEDGKDSKPSPKSNTNEVKEVPVEQVAAENWDGEPYIKRFSGSNVERLNYSNMEYIPFKVAQWVHVGETNYHFTRRGGLGIRQQNVNPRSVPIISIQNHEGTYQDIAPMNERNPFAMRVIVATMQRLHDSPEEENLTPENACKEILKDEIHLAMQLGKYPKKDCTARCTETLYKLVRGFSTDTAHNHTLSKIACRFMQIRLGHSPMNSSQLGVLATSFNEFFLSQGGTTSKSGYNEKALTVHEGWRLPAIVMMNGHLDHHGVSPIDWSPVDSIDDELFDLRKSHDRKDVYCGKPRIVEDDEDIRKSYEIYLAAYQDVDLNTEDAGTTDEEREADALEARRKRRRSEDRGGLKSPVKKKTVRNRGNKAKDKK